MGLSGLKSSDPQEPRSVRNPNKPHVPCQTPVRRCSHTVASFHDGSGVSLLTDPLEERPLVQSARGPPLECVCEVVLIVDEVEVVQFEEHQHRQFSRALVAVDKRVTLDQEERVGGGLVGNGAVGILPKRRLLGLADGRVQQMNRPQALGSAEGQGLGVQVQHLVCREVDHTSHGLPLRQALEGRAIGGKHLPLRGGDLGPSGISMRGDHDPLAFNRHFDFSIRFEVDLFQYRAIENDPTRRANARQSLYEWHASEPPSIIITL